MTYIQKKRVKLVLLGLGVIVLYIYLLFTMTGCATAPTHTETCNSFVGKDYYEINNELGEVVWTDFRGDDMIRAYKKDGCTTIVHINRQNLITSWETKGKCE